MKKIGILTFHRSFNYGAILQVYSLCDRIQFLCDKQDIDAKVEIIDYDSVIHRRSTYFHSGVLVKRPQKIPGILKNYIKVKTLQKFQEKELPLSSSRLVSDNFSKSIDFINNMNYDLIITGSDEIWRLTKGLPFPNVYMLPGAINAKKVSYSPSANRTLLSDIGPERKSHIKNCLLDYDYISVRDKYSHDIFSDIVGGEKEIEICPDPTFGLDIPCSDGLLKQIFSKYGISLSGKPLVALVGLPEKVSYNIVSIFSEKYNFCTIVNQCKGVPFISKITPLEWAAIFKEFSLCITGLFHGTIFCLKNHLPFITLELDSKYTHFESKVKYLLSQAGLTDRLFEYKGGVWDYQEIDSKIESLLEGDNFDYISYLEDERMKMDKYLQKVLELIK